MNIDTGYLVILLTLGLPIVSVLGYFWHEVQKTRSYNHLKQDMLDRGMSAEDIERIMNAGTKKKNDQ